MGFSQPRGRPGTVVLGRRRIGVARLRNREEARAFSDAGLLSNEGDQARVFSAADALALPVSETERRHGLWPASR